MPINAKMLSVESSSIRYAVTISFRTSVFCSDLVNGESYGERITGHSNFRSMRGEMVGSVGINAPTQEILCDVMIGASIPGENIQITRNKVEVRIRKLLEPAAPADDDLVSCARCNEMKECLLIETGFAGEHEPLCAKCISEERRQAESQRHDGLKCPRCMGTGKYQRLPMDPETECAVCNGTGEIPKCE